MASTPSVTSETQASQTAVPNILIQDVNEATDNFMKALDGIAEKHGLCVCFQTVIVPDSYADA